MKGGWEMGEIGDEYWAIEIKTVKNGIFFSLCLCGHSFPFLQSQDAPINVGITLL